ncbi:unnamed protein product, partial [Ixodes pacificus]
LKFAPLETTCLQGTDQGTKETPSRLVRHLAFPVARSLSSRHVANPPSTRINRTPSPSRFRTTRRPEEPGSVDYLPSCAESPETTDSVYRCPTTAVASRLGRAVPRARLEGQRMEKLDQLALGPGRCPPMKCSRRASPWASVLSPTARGSNCGE